MSIYQAIFLFFCGYFVGFRNTEDKLTKRHEKQKDKLREMYTKRSTELSLKVKELEAERWLNRLEKRK